MDRLQTIKKRPSNRSCADCDSYCNDWASVTFGIFLCDICAGKHRGIGTHITFIRSVSLDEWTDEQIDIMEVGGNAKCIEALISKNGKKLGRAVGYDGFRKHYDSPAARNYKKKIVELAKKLGEKKKHGSDTITPSESKSNSVSKAPASFWDTFQFGSITHNPSESENITSSSDPDQFDESTQSSLSNNQTTPPNNFKTSQNPPKDANSNSDLNGSSPIDKSPAKNDEYSPFIPHNPPVSISMKLYQPPSTLTEPPKNPKHSSLTQIFPGSKSVESLHAMEDDWGFGSQS